MPRTTLDIDASILEQLRRRAESESKSMGQVASERLAIGLREDGPREPTPLQWPRKRMGRPTVDLEDKDDLWRALEEPRPGSSQR